MKKRMKLCLIVSLVLFCTGSILFGFGMIGVKGDVAHFSPLKVVQTTYTENAENPVSSVRITHRPSADVKIAFSDSATAVTMEYGRLYTKKNEAASYFSLTDENGELRLDVREKTGKTWLATFSDSPKITLTLPSSREYAISVKTTTGNIDFEGTGTLSTLSLETDTGNVSTQNAVLTASEMRFRSDTGNVKIGVFTAHTLLAEADTGNITVSGGNATGTVRLETDTGDVTVKGELVAAEIQMDTDTGNCKTKGGVLTADAIALETDTGDVSVTLSGKQSDYSIYVNTDTGKSNIGSQAGGAKTLKIDLETGDIAVYFQE